MPTYDEINLTGMQIDSVDWAGSVLRANFGHGYGAFARTGNAAGLHYWKLSDGGVLPDRTTADCLPISGQSRFDYYYEFFKSHTTGTEEIFIIQWRGKKYHACFVDPKQSFERFTEDLFSGGVDIRQRRVAGFLYSSDGSIDSTPPSVPEDLAVSDTSESSITLIWSASTD
jgi:hypothetical protein